MALKERQDIMSQIKEERSGRHTICFLNFDRDSSPPVPGLRTQFASDTKESLFRVLKETLPASGKIDLFLYTRGGDTNAVWPIASLLREFDVDFEVLVPFRCHSGGTLLSLAAKKIVMTQLAELSPIDPSTGNQFNPTDALGNRMPISVEDVQAYRSFIIDQFKLNENKELSSSREILRPLLERLSSLVHPLALGNVHRVHQQIKQLARNLLNCHPIKNRKLNEVIEALTTRFYSHLHMINRYEAQEILGERHVEFAPDRLSQLLDELLRTYEDNFALRKNFFLASYLGDEPSKEARFIGGAIESEAWSYLFETKVELQQHSSIPPNVQIQIPPGQKMPLIPGLPMECKIEMKSQGWIRNKEPRGITT